MGVSLVLKNLDEVFHASNHVVNIINDISVALASEKEDFNRKIYTRYSGDDLLSNLPTCDCGAIVGEYNLGVTCAECNTQVKETTMQELQPIIWMRAPVGVKSLINPVFWVQISDFFSRSNFDVLRWIADTNYHPIIRTPAVMDAVKSVIPDRGYNYFLENFYGIIEALMELKVYRTPPKRKIAADLMELMRHYPDALFPQYLPLPNKALLVIEKSNVGTYIDTTVSGAVDAIRTMTAIDLPETNFTTRVKENRTIKTICQLSDFYVDWYSKSLAGKTGIMRKHVFGSRSDFSFRAVISSISEAHEYDEIYISWGIAVSVFRIHLSNKLMKRGFTANQTIAFLDEHAQKYHPDLADMFDELIAECPYKGIPIILGRNPSLQRGSTQQLYISKIKHDVQVPTISLSLLVIRSFNADFDGKLPGCRRKTLLIAGNSLELDELQRSVQTQMRMFENHQDWTISSEASFMEERSTTIA